MVVSGGLTWWRDFLCTACYNLLDQRDEVSEYNIHGVYTTTQYKHSLLCTACYNLLDQRDEVSTMYMVCTLLHSTNIHSCVQPAITYWTKEMR